MAREELMSEREVWLYRFDEAEVAAIAAANDPALEVALTEEHRRGPHPSLCVTVGRHVARTRVDEIDGAAAARLRVVRLPNPEGLDWTGHAALRFDIHNPHDEMFALDLDVHDGRSEGWHRGYYEPRWRLVPGWNEFVVGLGEGLLRGEHKEEPLDLHDMRAVQLTIRPGIWGERTLFVSNVRLAPDGDEAAALAANRQAAEEFTARRLAAPEHQAALAAAADLEARIEEAKRGGLDTIYPEAMLFAARVGLDLRARLPWFSAPEQQQTIHAFVHDICGRAARELDEVSAGARRPRALTRRSPRELTLEGAYWHCGDEPVLLTAMLYNSTGPLMRFFHPHEILPCLLTTAGASRYDVERTPLYAAFKRYPDTHRVGYDDWCGHLIRDRWSMGGGNEEIVICLESPHMKHAMAQAIRAKTPRPEDRPDMLVHVMEGELSYCCYCDHTQRLFRQFVVERHGTLEAVNEAWATSYASEDEILTPHHKQWDANRARWFDFVEFNQQRFIDHHSWAKRQVREIDPTTPMTTGGIFYLFSARQGLLGVDNEGFVDQVCEAAEAEAGQGPGIMPTDFLWAVCDDRKPIIDLEYHSDIFSWWPHFLHGYAALAMWFWPAADREQMLDTSVPHSPHIPLAEVEKLLTNALDLQRLGRYVVPFPRQRSPFAILYSRSTLLQTPADAPRSIPYSDEVARLYRATLSLDAGRTFITERDLRQGQASRFSVIALPDVTYLHPQAFADLMQFVEEGGTLLITGDSLRADHYARPADYLSRFGIKTSRSMPDQQAKDESAESQPFGPGDEGWSPRLDPRAYHLDDDMTALLGQAPRLSVEADGAEVLVRFEDGRPGLLRSAVGRGRVYFCGARLAEESLLALMERLLAEAGIRPMVEVREADGSRPADIEARAVEHEGAVLAYVINSRTSPLEVALEFDRPLAEIEDLRTLERGPFTGRVTVPARDTALYRLTPS
jgi:beta-galactosidase